MRSATVGAVLSGDAGIRPRWRGLVGALVALGLLAAACSGQSESAEGSAEGSGEGSAPTAAPTPLAPSPPFDRAHVRLRAPDGSAVEWLHVYVAVEPDERARGLMERESLARRGGMLFEFDVWREGGFWMKNTLIPLSIAFADDEGVITDILDMEPCAEEPCPTYRPEHRYQRALEVNQGAFEELGVEPGWQIELVEDA